MRLKFLLWLVLSLTLSSQLAHAQYVDPLQCLPPTGQQLYEIAANNLTRNYKDNPTPANKSKMCTRFKSVVKVYQNAVTACARSSCQEEGFHETCARKAEKLKEWKEKYAYNCSGKRKQ